MSRYRLTFHLMTTDPEIARSAVADAARLVEERTEVEEQIADVRKRLGLTVGILVFRVEGEPEARLLGEVIRRLPGLPPLDAVRVKRLGR